MQRLASFASYRNEKNVFVCKLSGGGFSYKGYENLVECTGCGFQCNGWQDIGDLFGRHQEHSPDCIFVQQNHRGSDNLKLQKKTNAFSRSASVSGSADNHAIHRTSNKCRDTEKVRQSEAESDSNRQTNLASAKQVFQNLGIHVDLNRSKHPTYAVLATRVSSYTSADSVFHKPASIMAQAGFFYKGYSDHVCCFSCGGSLSEWCPEDDPWVEHAYWFPKCTFLVQNKGEEFVQKVQFVKQADDDKDRRSRLGDVFGTGSGAYSGTDEVDCVTLSAVLEMGYTEEQFRAAVNSLRAKNPTHRPIKAEDIVEILLQQDEEVTPLSSGPACASVCQGQNTTLTFTENQDCYIESVGSETELETVLKENRELQDMTICKVCMVEKVNIVFLPCGHIVTCAECAPAMRKCPMCRKMVMGTIRAFMS